MTQQPSTTEHFPTIEDAIAYRQAWNTRMKALYRATVPSLRAIVSEKHNYVLGGPVTKEDHIKVILEDEYPLANLNEAIHVVHHRDWHTDDCEWCPKGDNYSEASAAHAAISTTDQL